MTCEMCGKDENLYLTEVEGVELKVCKQCAAFGKTIKPLFEPPQKNKVIKRKSQPSKQDKTDKVKSIVSDYSKRIRKAREKLGLKQEEFARKLNEKESIVQKMETDHYKPSLKLAEKLEKLLNIKLIEEHEEEKIQLSKQESGPLTIGDMIKVKK